MRVFEVALIIGLSIQSFVLINRKFSKATGWATAFALIVGGLQFGLEGARWQLAPPWFLLALLSTLSIVVKSKATNTRSGSLWKSAVVTTFLVTALTIATILPTIFPVFQLPQPSGPFPVGSTTRYIADTDRPEIFTAYADDFRELTVRIWFPAEETGDLVRQPYWIDASRRSQLMARSWNLPGFLFNHLDLVSTHSFAQARVSSKLDNCPVVVLSHGLTQDIQAKTRHFAKNWPAAAQLFFR